MLYAAAEFDIVHINAEFADPPSDHDPVVARFDIAAVPEPVRAWPGLFTKVLLRCAGPPLREHSL